MVISLFACLHDSQRENEWDDPTARHQAARYTQRLYDEGLLDLNRVQLAQLLFACAHHSDLNAMSVT